LALQIRELRAYAERQGWDTAEVYRDLMSGAKTSRLALNRRLDHSQFQAGLVQASQQAARANANNDHGDAAMKDAPTTASLVRKLVEAGAAPAMSLPSAEVPLPETNAQKQQAIANQAQKQAIAQLNQAKAQAPASRSQVSLAQAQAAQGNAAVDGANQPEPYRDRSADRRRRDSAQCGRGPDLVSVLQNSGD
jgi:hypothetical protein